jgi:hypothetical protein
MKINKVHPSNPLTMGAYGIIIIIIVIIVIIIIPWSDFLFMIRNYHHRSKSLAVYYYLMVFRRATVCYQVNIALLTLVLRWCRLSLLQGE